MSVRDYRELEALPPSPTFETLDRISKLYGWLQTLLVTAREVYV